MSEEWLPRTKDARLALNDLKMQAPEYDWERPSSVYHSENMVRHFDNECGKWGFRCIGPGFKNFFKPSLCRNCPACIYEESLLVCQRLLLASQRATTEAVWVQVFDLSTIAERRPSGRHLALVDKSGQVKRFEHWFGFQLQDRVPLDKVKDRESARIGYQAKKGRKLGGCALPIATLKSTIFELQDGRGHLPYAVEHFGLGPFLVVFSEAQPRVYRNPAHGSLEPKLAFRLPVKEMLPYAKGLLDLSRERIFNPSGSKRSRACRASWYGTWKPDRPEGRARGLGIVKVSGVRVGDWPWSKLDDRLRASKYQEGLSALVEPALANLATVDADTVHQYKDWLQVHFKLKEAVTMFREKADDLSRRRTKKQGSKISKRARCYLVQAQRIEKAILEFEGDVLRYARLGAEGVWPMAGEWGDVLKPLI